MVYCSVGRFGILFQRRGGKYLQLLYSYVIPQFERFYTELRVRRLITQNLECYLLFRYYFFFQPLLSNLFFSLIKYFPPVWGVTVKAKCEGSQGAIIDNNWSESVTFEYEEREGGGGVLNSYQTNLIIPNEIVGRRLCFKKLYQIIRNPRCRRILVNKVKNTFSIIFHAYF